MIPLEAVPTCRIPSITPWRILKGTLPKASIHALKRPRKRARKYARAYVQTLKFACVPSMRSCPPRMVCGSSPTGLSRVRTPMMRPYAASSDKPWGGKQQRGVRMCKNAICTRSQTSHAGNGAENPGEATGLSRRMGGLRLFCSLFMPLGPRARRPCAKANAPNLNCQSLWSLPASGPPLDARRRPCGRMPAESFSA